MNSRTLAILVGAIIVIHCSAISAAPDSTDAWIPGVLFTIGTDDGVIAGNGNALSVWLGAGYDISTKVRATVEFSTGHHHLGIDDQRPIGGTLLLGAGTVEVLYFFSNDRELSPFVGASAGLATDLDAQGNGYNGWVAGAKTGLAWIVGPAIAVEGAVGWHLWTWQNGVGGSMPSFGTFRVSSFAVGLSLVFHPVLNSPSQ